MVHCWPLGMKVLARYLVFSDTPLAEVLEYLIRALWNIDILVPFLARNGWEKSQFFPLLFGAEHLVIVYKFSIFTGLLFPGPVGFCWGFFFFFCLYPLAFLSCHFFQFQV